MEPATRPDRRNSKRRNRSRHRSSGKAHWPARSRFRNARNSPSDASNAVLALHRAIAALAQAKLEYAREVLEICSRFRCRAFASVVDKDSPSPETDHVRKDYAYLFERFFYFLEDLGPDAFGVAVFDEIEKVQSHLLVSQMDSYFKRTARGRQRAGRILPEPLFVHSDLTTGVQLADLVAYILSWGWRLRSMTRPARPELAGFAGRICQLRHRAVREVAGNPHFTIWSFAFITDLRPQGERELEAGQDTGEQ